MKHPIFITVVLLMTCISCSKRINVIQEAYDFKTFGKTIDQSPALDRYKSPNERPGQDADQLLIVCASGGGSRAASYTMGVLLELEKIMLQTDGDPAKESNIADEIDYFSTTSGGGWGSGAFIAHKYLNWKYQNVYQRENPFPTFNSFEDNLANIADYRYAKNQLRYFMAESIINGSKHSDRVFMNRLNVGYLGWGYRAVLEEAFWKRNHKDPFVQYSVDEIMLKDVFVPINANALPQLPMLITNTTNIDNYKLVPFTPDRLASWGVMQYNGVLGDPNPVTPSVPLSESELLEIPLASAIKASSSVPGMIGSSYFKAKKNKTDYYLHLQDGGLVDNQGLHTAKAILDHEHKITDPLKRIVIVIDASGSGVHNHKEKFKKKFISGAYSAKRGITATPDAQYPLMRERLIAMEKEYNCTVIYLGTEVLIDKAYGMTEVLPEKFTASKKDAEQNFYKLYPRVCTDPYYFNTVPMREKCLLYEYISQEVSTWFTSKNSANNGKYVMGPEQRTGTASIMFLAGRGVVQLKKNDIAALFNKAPIRTDTTAEQYEKPQ